MIRRRRGPSYRLFYPLLRKDLLNGLTGPSISVLWFKGESWAFPTGDLGCIETLRAEQLALAGKLRAEKGVDIQPLVIDVSAPSADSRPAAKKADTANKKAKTKARKKSKKSKSKTKSKRKRARKGATT